MKRYRPPKSKFKRRLRLAVVILLILSLAVTAHVNITNTLFSLAEASMRTKSAAALNHAALQTLNEKVSYDELVKIERNQQGDITALTANAYSINKIARNAALYAQTQLKELAEQGIDVPIGAFFGIDAWAGFGPSVKMKIISLVGVTSSFFSQFESAGLNQTRHAIYLEVTAEICVITPTRTRTFSYATQTLACESVLLGKVPQNYYHGNIFGGGYSLLPNG